MPLLKIFIDERLGRSVADALVDGLGDVRDLLCRELEVDPSLCQFSVVTCRGLVDQSPVSAEIALMPAPGRTRERVTAICEQLKAHLAELSGTRATVRATMIDPDKYLALR